MPSTGDNLSINALAGATGASPKSLLTAAGGSGSNITVTSFTITGVTTPTTNTNAYAYGASVTITTNFTSAGSRFLSRIGSRSQNFTWPASISGLTLSTNSGYTRTYTNTYNPGGTSCSSAVSRTASITFNDGFNTPASNYNVSLTTASFTLYSPPKPSVTGYSSTPPPRACNPGGGCGNKCYGADFSISASFGSYAGVNGSSLTYYINGTPYHTGGTNWTSARVFCGNTNHSLFVQNNFGCNSDTTTITSAAYV